MDMQALLAYIRPELLVMIPVLMFIGKAFKNSKIFPDEIIPFLLMVISVVVSGLYVLAIMDVTGGWQSVLICIFNIIIQGILIARVATWGHQCYKQTKKLQEKEDPGNRGDLP